MTSVSRLLLKAALLLLAAACAARPTPSPVSGPGEAVSRLHWEAADRTSLRGLAHIRMEGPGQNGSASQVVLVALPDKARLETQSAIGTTAVVVVLRGEELRVQNFLRHEYVLATASQESLGRLAGVPAPPRPLLRLLLGLPPLPVRTDDPRLKVTPAEGGFLIETVEGRFWQRLRAQADGAVVGGELGQGEQALLRFEFKDFRPVSGAEFPFTILLEQADAGGRLQLQYEMVALNAALPDSLFDLPPPQDGRTKILNLEGAPR